MTVVYDLLGAQNRDHGERGIARYVLHLALEIERCAPGLVDTYLVRGDLPIPGGLEPLVATGRVRRFERDRRCWDIAGGGVFVCASPFELAAPTDTVLPRPFRDPAWRRIAVLYDLIPLRFPEIYLHQPWERHRYLARVELVRIMDHLLAISQATADDAVELLGHAPATTTMIGAGADDRFRPHPDGPAAAAVAISGRIPGLRPGYLMAPSGIEPRKNIPRLLEAYAGLEQALRRAHQLVLVCKTTPSEARELAETATRLGIDDDLLVTGFVRDEDLVGLYQGAHLVAFPSLYEGFGLPVLEAMQCGAPAICSDSSSLREVQPDPTARFDPHDVGAIRDALARVLTDDAERERIRAIEPPRFSWADAARGTIDAIVADRHTAPPRRLRVALVTPMPPQASGIATYAGRLVDELRHWCDLTVFVDHGLDEVEPVEGVAIHETHAFDSIDGSGRPFDRIVTFLGNSHFHVDALELVRRVGGTVVLHDARMTGLYGEVQRSRPERLVDGTVGHTLATRYPGRYREALVDSEVVAPDVAATSGVHLLAEIVDAADLVLVHSRFAAVTCELDTGVRPEVPFALPCAPTPDLDGARVPGRLVTTGLVSPAKQPELLLEALAILRRRVPDSHLHFVGGVPDDYRVHLDRRIEALGLSEAVEVAGHLDDGAFARELARAAIAVQLRATTNGESSAAVNDALSAGTPTVVTALGAQRELPDDVVVKVPAEVTAAELAAELESLLTDPARLVRVETAARSYAGAHTYAAAARRLAEAIGLPIDLESP